MIKLFIKTLKNNAKLAKNRIKFILSAKKSSKKSYAAISQKSSTPIKFKDIFYQHDQNVSDKWVNYFDIYDDCLSRHIGTNPHVLEIGIQNGGSLQIFNKYLQNAELYGVDIDPNIANLTLENNIHIYNFDITDEQAIAKHFKNIDFDIIIDDGSHLNSDIIKTFKLLFAKLKPGGIFLIEDLHTSYWKSYGGSYLGTASAMEFFKKFTDLLNFYHIEDDRFVRNTSKLDKQIFKWLQSISFYDSMVVIHKLFTPRKTHYERVIVGTMEPVTPVIEIAKQEGWYHY